jgi:hypothetical protein
MIYCSSGSGSYVGKVCFRFQYHIQTYLAQFFNNKKFLFRADKQHCLPESWHLNLDFLIFVFHFMLDPGPNLVPEPKPVPLRQKVAVPVTEPEPVPLRQKVAVPVPVPQH